MSKYSLKVVMQPLVKDVFSLERDGIMIHDEVNKGTVLYVTGDNLSSH